MKLSTPQYRKQRTPLLLSICITLFYFAASMIKYDHFTYSGLDVAIFNQVFWNTVHGTVYGFSFHGNTYLGDHLSIVILFLAPLYAIIKHPLTLLFLQSLAIGIGIIPFYALIKTQFSTITEHILFMTLYACSALIGAVAFNEFHMIALFIPLAITTYYYYHIGDFQKFVIFFILSCLIREDIALIMIMFALLALFDKRNNRWIFFPALFASSYAYLAFTTVQNASRASYKFLFLYDHLGSSLSDIARTIITHPALLLNAALNPLTITFIFYLITPLLFFPLLSRKHLIFLIPPLFQFSLSNVSLLSIIQTHYMAFFAPFVLIGALFGYKRFIEKKLKERRDQRVVLCALAVASIAAFIGLSGVRDVFSVATTRKDTIKTAFNHEALSRVPADAPVVASVDILPNLSSRRMVFPWMYIIKGKEQFRTDNIAIPSADFLILDSFESLLYKNYFDTAYQSHPSYYSSPIKRDQDIRHFFQKNTLKAEQFIDELALFSKNGDTELITISLAKPSDPCTTASNLLVYSINVYPEQTITLNNERFTVLPTSITYSSPDSDRINGIRVSFSHNPGSTKIIPLTYTLHDLWNEREYATVHYQFAIPQGDSQDTTSISIVELNDIEAYNNIGGINYSLGTEKTYDDISLSDQIHPCIVQK